MLVALVILSVSILAMTSVTLTAIKTNMHNEIRNAAIRLTSETVEQILAGPIDSAVSGTTDRNLRLRGGNYSFRVVRAVQNLTNDLRQVVITVHYNYRGQQYNNTCYLPLGPRNDIELTTATASRKAHLLADKNTIFTPRVGSAGFSLRGSCTFTISIVLAGVFQAYIAQLKDTSREWIWRPMSSWGLL
jgi:hypothetical protein